MANKQKKNEMKLVIGIIFNGSSDRGKLLNSIEVASNVAEEKGYSIVVIARIINSDEKNIKNILIIGGNTNIGFGASHNQLMNHAFNDLDADCYFCLNDDTVLAPNCLVTALDFLSCKKNELVLAECMQIPCEHPKPYDPLTFKTVWCSGAALFITREIYKLTKGFDDNLFMYCEDVDLSWRSIKYGATCYILPFSKVFHDVSPQGRKPDAVSKHMFISGRYLGYKWKAHEFQNLMEKKLVEGNFFASAEYLPPILSPSQYYSVESFCEFRQELSFSIPRW